MTRRILLGQSKEESEDLEFLLEETEFQNPTRISLIYFNKQVLNKVATNKKRAGRQTILLFKLVTLVNVHVSTCDMLTHHRLNCNV